MSKNKTLKVFSSATVAGMVAAAMVSSQAFAAVDAYSVKVGSEVYNYNKEDLKKSLVDYQNEEGDGILYKDYLDKLSSTQSVYAYHDDKAGFIDGTDVVNKFLEADNANQKFNIDEYTESKDAKKIEVPQYKKAVVKDGKVVYVDAVTPDDEKAPLAITSVEALNLKQVKINFNKAVTDGDKIDDIEDEENYIIEDKDKKELEKSIDKVEVDESKKFAILTFKDRWNHGKYDKTTKTDEAIQNQEKYLITFDENITGKEVKKEVEFKDFDMPEVKKVEPIGVDTVKIVFSEPVRPNYFDDNKKVPCLDDDTVEINNDDISVDRIELTKDNTEANVYLGTKLKDKKALSVKVKGTISDYAGLGVVSKTENLIVKTDETKPKVVGSKNSKKGEITLIFDKDIKFKNDDIKVKPRTAFDDEGNVKDDSTTINGKIKEFYHTNDSNYAYAVKIDGKELTMYFNEDKRGVPESAYAYIDAEELQSLWEVKNDKVSVKVERPEDKEAPEVKSVKQDKNVANKIKVKFNEELKKSEAEKKDNYTIKDKDGKEWKISGNPSYDNSDKEVTITTTKDLDSGKYTLNIKNVEDKSGNTIKETSKEFEVVGKDALEYGDLSINLYKSGSNDQKIVVDFDDKKMKTGNDKFAVDDASKYALVANKDIFDGKKTILVSDLYNAKVNAKADNHKVELVIPSKENKSASYKIEVTDDGKYRVYGKDVTSKESGKDYAELTQLDLEIGRVSDVDGNINATAITKKIEGEKSVGFKKDAGKKMVRSIATDKMQITFEDKITFKNDDVKVIAATDRTALNKAIQNIKDGKNASADNSGAELINVTSWDKIASDNTSTVIELTLDSKQELKFNNNNNQEAVYNDDDNNHILNYDGTFGTDNKKVYVVVDEFKDGEIKSENDYDAKIAKDIVEVEDYISPAIIDNNKRNEKYLNRNNNDEAVEYWQDGTQGAIVLSFEENIDPKSVSTATFELNKDDFEEGKIDSVSVNGNKVIVSLKDLKDEGEVVNIKEGFQLIQKSPLKDMNDNEVNGLRLEVGDFDRLNATKLANAMVGTDKTTQIKADVNNAITNVNADATLNVNATFVVNNDDAKITATVKNEAVKVKDAVLIQTINDKNLMPTSINIDGQNFKIKTAKVTDIQAAIAKLAGKEGKFDEVTLKDLKGKSITANYGGLVYTLEVK